MRRILRGLLVLALSQFNFAYGASLPHKNADDDITLYRWVDSPKVEQKKVNCAKQQLDMAMHNPEYMLTNWIELPIAPKPKDKDKVLHLSIRDAILLALRYNPNIKNAELDRIIQRYQLRLAHNQFELQFAIGGTAFAERIRYENVGHVIQDNYIATPELDYNTESGGKVVLKMDNNIATFGNYNPLINLTVSQPLLRGFGKKINKAGLYNAIDREFLNKLQLRQSVMDQITLVASSYRDLVLSVNNLQNQQRQLDEARKSFARNEKKIKAGQLEPTANIEQSYQIESLSLLVEQASNEFKNSAQNLLQTIGLDPEMRLAVPDDVEIGTIKIPDVEKTIKQALSHNAEYLALKMAVRANQRAFEVAKNEQLWQLDFSAKVQAGTMTSVDGRGHTFRDIYNGNSLTESVGVTLQIPVKDLNRRDKVIGAKVQLEKDRLNLIAAKRTLITSIKNTITTIESLAKRYSLAKRQVKLASAAYELEKKKQQAGIASSLDVNNTQNQLIQAQIGLISAKVAYLNQLSGLQKTVGTTLDYWQVKLRYGDE